MTEEAVAQKYGDQGLQNVRNALGDRAGYVTQFAFVELAPFHRSKSLTDLVNALAPANMHQNQRLPQGDFKALVTAMGEPADPMSAEQMIELVWDLAALTKAEIARLVLSLIANDVRPKRVHKIIHGMRSGGGNAANLKTMIDGLRGTLTKKETADVISELLAVGGQSIYQTYADLCQGEVGGISAANYRAVIRLLRNPPEHTNALSEQQTVTFIHALQSKGCTGKQIHEIATALIPGLTPTQANTLVTRYLVSLTGAELHNLITTKQENPGQKVIRPVWLLNASDKLPAHLKTCIADQQKGGITKSRKLIALMDQFALPAAEAPGLLALFPKLGNKPLERIEKFLKGTQANDDWEKDVLPYLQRFLNAGRSPHGADNKRFPDNEIGNAGGGGSELRRRTVHRNRENAVIGQYDVVLKKNWLNKIRNSHTYERCDFKDRIDRNINSNEFWGKKNITEDEIIEAFNNVSEKGLADLVYDLKTQYDNGGKDYKVEIFINLEVGLRYQRDGSFLVTHLSPTGQDRVPLKALKAIQYLFDPPPPG